MYEGAARLGILAINLFHKQLHALTADFVARRCNRGHGDASTPGKRITIATCYFNISGNGKPILNHAGYGSRRKYIGERDDEVGAFVSVALSELYAQAKAVCRRVPFACIDNLELNFEVLSNCGTNAVNTQIELRKCRFANNRNV